MSTARRWGRPAGDSAAGRGPTPAVGLLAAAALHLGFQAVVTTVVYPALAEVPADRWDAAHSAHSRRVTRVVVPVYGVLAAACLRALGTRPASRALGVAVTGAATAGAATALVAGPTHGRLGRDGASPELLGRLRRADRVRLVGAAVAAGAALAAVRAEAGRGPRGG